MVKALQNRTCLVQNRTVQNNLEINRNCCLVLTACMFMIKIKLNNVHSKHDKQHGRGFHAIHHNFVSIIK
jgi:hypothetical protein